MDTRDSNIVANKYTWDIVVIWSDVIVFDVRRFFDGTVEIRDAPRLLTDTEIYNHVSCITNVFGKSKPKRRSTNINEDNWKKRNIFFDLPY